MKSNILIFSAFVLGILVGLLSIPPVFITAKIIADLFISFLKLISLPIIFLSIVATIINMSSLNEAKLLLRKVLLYTLITTVISALVGLALYLAIHPKATGYIPTTPSPTATMPSYLAFLKTLIPSNLIEPFATNNVIGVGFIAAILSFAILKLPQNHKEPLQNFFQSLFQALLKISAGVVRTIPLAVFCFTILFMQQLQNTSDLKPALWYAATIIGANLIQGLIVLPLLLKSKGIKPYRLAKAMAPALTTAFFSKSSNAALPFALSRAEKHAKLNPRVSSISFPLCSVINMNGCAAFILITFLFVLGSSGYTLTFLEMLPWVAIATIAAIGNASVPMGCYFLTSACLLGFDVNMSIMGFIVLPLYSLFDMIETALNVWSDSCVTAIVDRDLKQSAHPTPLAAEST